MRRSFTRALVCLATALCPATPAAQTLSGNCGTDFFSGMSATIQYGSPIPACQISAQTIVSHPTSHPLCSQQFTAQAVLVGGNCTDTKNTNHDATGGGTSANASKTCSVNYDITYTAGGVHWWNGAGQHYTQSGSSCHWQSPTECQPPPAVVH